MVLHGDERREVVRDRVVYRRESALLVCCRENVSTDFAFDGLCERGQSVRSRSEAIRGELTLVRVA